eukprot:3123022-Rhodomonas_salina.7
MLVKHRNTALSRFALVHAFPSPDRCTLPCNGCLHTAPSMAALGGAFLRGRRPDLGLHLLLRAHRLLPPLEVAVPGSDLGVHVLLHPPVAERAPRRHHPRSPDHEPTACRADHENESKGGA